MPVAVITGASRGLGAALAHALDARGWDLVVDARDADALAVAVGASTARAVPGDVNDPAHRRALAEAAAGLGGADLLVNNASTLGASPMPRLVDLTHDVLEDVLRTNVVAPHALTRALLPQLVARRGTVLNVTSDASVEPYEGWGAYGASKAAPSTPATCAPRCTRTRSPTRTSPTGPSRPLWCRTCWHCWTVACPAVATGPPT